MCVRACGNCVCVCARVCCMCISQSAVFDSLQPYGLVAHQAPLSMGFSRQRYWSALPIPSGDLPDPGIEPGFPTLQADSLLAEPPRKQRRQFKHPRHTPKVQWPFPFLG